MGDDGSASGLRCEEDADLVVDIGGTKVLAALVRDGAIIDQSRLDSGGLAPDALASRITSVALGLSRAQGRRIRSALVAVPGKIDREAGVVVRAANLPFRDFPLGAVLQEGLGGVAVSLEHDANCGAVGEAWALARGPVPNLVYVTLSTGIGMGALVRGALVEGAHGYAGELGHVTVVPGGRPCGCGAEGCLEAYASGTAIASLGRELLRSSTGTVLRGALPSSVTAKDVVAGAEAGDPGCLDIIDNACALVQGAVRMLQLVLDPEVVVMGGGLMSNEFFAERLLAPFPGDGSSAGTAPVVVKSSYFGAESVVIGSMHLLTDARAGAASKIGAA